MLKKFFALSLSALTCFVAVTAPIGDQSLLSKFGVSGVDVVSHATGGGGGGVTPVDPIEQEEDPGVPIPDEDKALPYESDFVSHVEYNNAYGFLIVNINPDFLNGGFVNQIRYIGIKDTKYEYSTINKDKSRWYAIYVPYKYVEHGLNDFYFYMDDITYKVALDISGEFSKEKIAPKLIPLENVDGTDVAFKLKFIHNSDAEKQDFYNTIRENLKEKMQIIEIFTMSKLDTPIKSENYDVSIDEDQDILTIQFKNGTIIYQGLYVYRVIIEADHYTNTYSDVILYEHAPKLKSQWQTQGDKSLKIIYDDGENSIYLGEIKKLELIKLNDQGEGIETKELEKGKGYTSTWDSLSIPAKEFESNTKYKLKFSHRSVQTIELEIESPEISSLKVAPDLFVDDINTDTDLVISFKDEHKDWIENWSNITLYDMQSKPYSLRPIEQKAKDDEENGYVEGDWYRQNPNKYYTLDKNANTMTIESKYLDRTERWTFKFEAEGYEEVKTSFYISDPSNSWGSKAPRLEAKFLTDSDYSLNITAPDDKMHSMLRVSSRKRKLYGPSIILHDNTEGTYKRLDIGKDADFWGSYKDGGYYIQIFAKNFKSGHEYTAILTHRDYPSAKVTIIAPSDMPKLKEAPIRVDNINANAPIVIQAAPDFIQNVSSVFLRDERGFNLTLEEKDFKKEDSTITIPFEKSIGDEKIARKTGSFLITVDAKGYVKASTDFMVKISDITAKFEPQAEYDRVRFSFFAKDNLLEYAYPDTVHKVTLNGNELSATQYVVSVGATIYISDRMLPDGESVIKFESNRYTDVETTFQYDNQKLRDEKQALLEALKESELSQEKIDAFKQRIESAKTLRELRTVKIDVKVGTIGLQNQIQDLKKEYLEKIDKAELTDAVKKQLKEELSKLSKIEELKKFDDKIEEKIVEHKNAQNNSSSGSNNTGSSSYSSVRPDAETIKNDPVPQASADGITLPFNDLVKGNSYEAIAYLFGKGILSGTSKNTFSPNAHLNRAMVVSMLHKIDKAEVKTKHSFTDVKDNAWYANSVSWAAENGIVTGKSKDKFHPNDLITKQELALILMNYAKYRGDSDLKISEISKFEDHDKVAPWAKDALGYLVASGVIEYSESNKKLDPNLKLTREQTALILHQFLTNNKK